jgi:hypothetical protein
MNNNMITLFQQLDWWQRQDRGSFNLELYLQICRAKLLRDDK